METGYKLMILSSSYNDLEKQIISDKLKLTEYIIDTIYNNLDTKEELIPLFAFRETEFEVTLPRKSFKDNINNIYQFYISQEFYERCSRIVKLQKLLENNIKYEQEKT